MPQGFFMVFILFLICAVAYDTLLKKTIAAFQVLYFLSSFFGARPSFPFGYRHAIVPNAERERPPALQLSDVGADTTFSSVLSAFSHAAT